VKDEILNKETVHAQYKNLQHVEHAFRDLKSDNICIRPVYHRNEAQTRGHVQICVFAYAVIKNNEKLLAIPDLNPLQKKIFQLFNFNPNDMIT
jgi:transposase